MSESAFARLFPDAAPDFGHQWVFCIRHPGSRVEGVECETWDVRASHVYGQDLIGIEAG